jgi:hypothetical protein
VYLERPSSLETLPLRSSGWRREVSPWIRERRTSASSWIAYVEEVVVAIGSDSGPRWQRQGLCWAVRFVLVWRKE